MKKENGIIFLDRNYLVKNSSYTLKHTRIEFIQMNNLHPTLQTIIQVMVMNHEIAQIQEIDIL